MAARGLSSAAITELGKASVELYHLVRIDLTTTLYYTDAPYDITYDSNVYLSSAILGKVPAVRESLKITPGTIQLELSGASSEIHAIGHASDYKNADVYIYNHLPAVPETFTLFKGFIDSFENSEDVGAGESVVKLTIANHWADWTNSFGRGLTDENQQLLFPGDRGLEYVGVTDVTLDYWGRDPFMNATELAAHVERVRYLRDVNTFNPEWFKHFMNQGVDDPPSQFDWAASSIIKEKAPVIYGEASVKGWPVFRDVTGVDGEYLWVVYVLAEGECDSLSDVAFNGVSYTHASLSNYISVSFHAGTDSQTVDTALDAASAEWTSNHRLRGLAYVVIKYTYNAVWRGEPQPQFIVKGKKCTPIGGGTAVWTEDPPTILQDLLTNTVYGKSLATTDLDDFAAGSTYASTTVTDHDNGLGSGASSIPRYTFNGILDITKPIKDNIETILFSMNGFLPWVAGKYKLVIRRNDSTSVYSFTDDNITGQFTVSDMGVKSRANVVYYTYKDAEINYGELIEYTKLSDALIASEDNGKQLRKDIKNKFENNKYRAKNRSNTMLKESRGMIKMSLIASNADALQIETGNIVDITRSLQGYTAALFTVSEMSLKPDGQCILKLTEYDPTDYDWSVTAEQSNTTQSALTDPLVVAIPTSFVIVSGTAQLYIAGDGTVVSRAFVSFTEPADAFVDGYVLEYKQSSASTYDAVTLTGKSNTDVYIEPVLDGVSYDFRIRAYNQLGIFSAYVTTTYTIIGKTAVPPDVVGFTVLQNDNVAVFKWTKSAYADHDGVDIRFGPQTGGDYASATPLTQVTKGTNITSADVPDGDWRFYAKNVDTTGNYSTTAATKDLTFATDYDIITTVNEHPDFTGTLTDMVYHYTGKLVPDSQNLASADDWETFDEFVVNPVATCSYEGAEIDIDFDDTVRIWADITSTLGPGETTGIANPQFQIDYRLAADAYDGFENWSIGNVTARYIKPRFTVDTSEGLYYVSAFAPTADTLEYTQRGSSVTIDASGTTITYPIEFHNVPFYVSAQVQGATALFPTRDNITSTSFDIHIFNSSGTEVGGTADWEATGV